MWTPLLNPLCLPELCPWEGLLGYSQTHSDLISHPDPTTRLQEVNSMINKRLKDALFTDQWSELFMDALAPFNFVLVMFPSGPGRVETPGLLALALPGLTVGPAGPLLPGL